MTNPLLDTASLPRFDDISPDDVIPALEELISSNRNKLEAVLLTVDRDFDSVVAPLEAMEHELARVWSPVTHLQGVLGSPGWREAYNKGLPLLTEYGTELSQDTRLQQAYSEVASGLGEDAAAPQRTTVAQALRDFKLSGVDLPPAEKARFKEIMLNVHFLKANGKHSAKRFLIKDGDFADGEKLTIEKRQAFRPMTTRVLYPGTHYAELIVNGVTRGRCQFELLEK